VAAGTPVRQGTSAGASREPLAARGGLHLAARGSPPGRARLPP